MSEPSKVANAYLTCSETTVGFDSVGSSVIGVQDRFGLNSVADLGVEKTVLLGTEYSILNDYYFRLRFYLLLSDKECEKRDIVVRAAVPLFVNKNNYGVSIGQYSSATANDPMFESKWPAYFHGGIADFGDRWRALSWESDVQSPGDYGGGLLVARKIENRCIIKGSVNITPASTTKKIAMLPDSSWWPAGLEHRAVFSLNACQGRRIARIAVHSKVDEYPGYLCLEWVVNLSSGGLETSNHIWVQCSIEYWV